MKIGKQSFEFKNVYLNETATAVGPLENEGPLGHYFDTSFKDLRMKQKSFEQAEIKLQTTVINQLLGKAGYLDTDIDLILAGDLINQEVISNYSLRKFNIPFCGVYGACSTSMLSIAMAGLIIDGGNADKIITMTSSHNLTSERQFRNPNEYGGAKVGTTTFTVTGACAGLISNKKSKIQVKRATMGRIIDVDFTDSMDMGRAMAPAAIETLLTHFEDFKVDPKEYDLILTGDLSLYGSEIVSQVMSEKFGEFSNYSDCGLLIYDRNKQKVFAGGSGCACCGVVSYGYVKKMLENGELNRVLICATGALMNTDMTLQKESIPGVCHAVVLERVE